MGIITTINLDPEIHQLAKLKNLNVSKIANDALREALGLGYGNINSQQAAEAIKAAQESNIKDFLKITGSNVVDMPTALEFWASKTGKTIEELIQLKKQVLGLI